ncbi:hypothetical protein F5878DRAFT_674457, partial [Lentinula raphanica]
MEEDMERLRAWKRLKRGMIGYNHHHHSGGHAALPSSGNSSFSVDSLSSSVILGMGTGIGIRFVLPSKGTFFDCKQRQMSLEVYSTTIRYGGSNGMNKSIPKLGHRRKLLRIAVGTEHLHNSMDRQTHSTSPFILMTNTWSYRMIPASSRQCLGLDSQETPAI